MVKISAIIITYNEEKNIGRCIDSLFQVADEIVVIDSYSTDRTCDICIEKGVKLVKHPFKNHIDQKNFAITQATHDVILSLDADEYLSAELIRSILKIKVTWPFDVYRMNRLSNYGGKWIKHGHWYPDQKIRLWKKHLGLWGGENSHDKVVLKSDVKVMLLNGDLLHGAYIDSTETLDKIQNYSTIFAKENVGRRSISAFSMMLHTFFAFFKSYIIKRGFLDGYEGLVVAMAVANHVFYKYAKLYEANHKAALGKRIVISRTDNLGDVILTLPLIGYLKSVIPDAIITFIGKKYTQPVIEQSVFVDHFLDKEEVLQDPNLLGVMHADTIIFVYPDKKLARLAKNLQIQRRVATAHRIYNWIYCNQLVDFSRYRSNLHESQLNFKLLEPFKLNVDIDTSELIPFYGIKPALHDYNSLINKDRFNIILHPKSKGSAREWPLDSYLKLVNLLPAESYKIFITGLREEGEAIKREKSELLNHENVTDLTGKLNLEELTSFISQADGLVACSTGVLHLAAALGIFTLGLYSPMKPIHPGRWMPIGKHATYLALNEECNKCRTLNDCACIKAITAEDVKRQIVLFTEKKVLDKRMLGVA